jgi:glycosyltransferase involved in cell wall biosynthesis
MGDVDVSICIATCRRRHGLARLLDSIARLKLPDGMRAEVIAVDNDPASDPAEAPRADALAPLPLRWLREPRKNISYARNLAVANARGEWLAFVDDDEVVEERWLAAYWDSAGEGNADGYFGPVLPRIEAWFTPWLDESFFERARFATGTRITDLGAHTCNAFVRRSLFRDARFDPSFGRSGGEDTALFRRLTARGSRFEWVDEAIVHEYVTAERHRPGWLARRAFRGGCVHAQVEHELGRVPSRSAAVTQAAAAAGAFLLASAALLVGGRARALRFALHASVQAGKGWGHLGGAFQEYAD